MMNGFYYDGLSWGFGGWLMMVAMIIFWALIIMFVVRLVNGSRDGGHRDAPRAGRAMDLLKERYVKGEIEKKEFEEKKKVLGE